MWSRVVLQVQGIIKQSNAHLRVKRVPGSWLANGNRLGSLLHKAGAASLIRDGVLGGQGFEGA